MRHLHRDQAEREFRNAVETIDELEKCEAVEVAHARVLDLGELVHYYAGVTAALTLTDLIRK